MAITNLQLKPPAPRTYGHVVEVGDLVKTRNGYTGKVVKFENGQVTIDTNSRNWVKVCQVPNLTTAAIEEVIVEIGCWLGKIRAWMKAVDPSYDDFVSDGVARINFQRLKQAQVEARKSARSLKKELRSE